MTRAPASQRGYGWQWQKLRLLILQRDGYVCVYCGGHANSVDHIKPKIEGGGDDPTNLVASCVSCNSRRSARWVNRNRRGRWRSLQNAGGTDPGLRVLHPKSLHHGPTGALVD